MELTCWVWLVALGSAGVANAEIPQIGCNGRYKNGLGGDGCDKMADALNKLDGVSGVECGGYYPYLFTDSTAECKTVAAALNSLISQPAPYQKGVDSPGNDMAPCGLAGCILAAGSSHAVCEAKCKNTIGCAGYVFEDGTAPAVGYRPICWTKSVMGQGKPRAGRNSQVMAPVNASNIFCVEWEGNDEPYLGVPAGECPATPAKLTAILQGTCKHGDPISGPSGGGKCTDACDKGWHGSNCDSQSPPTEIVV